MAKVPGHRKRSSIVFGTWIALQVAFVWNPLLREAAFRAIGRTFEDKQRGLVTRVRLAVTVGLFRQTIRPVRN